MCVYSCCVQVLLPAASLLQLMDVRQVCCDFLQTQLHPTNCLGIRAFADLHACTVLLSQAHTYAGELFSFFMHCGKFGIANRLSDPPICIVTLICSFGFLSVFCLFKAEQHFIDVMVGEEFMALSLQQVCSLISSDKLTVSTEEKVAHNNPVF